MEESTSYDLNATCSYNVIPRGKSVVQIGLEILLHTGFYTQVAPYLCFEIKNFINVGTRVIESNEKSETRVVVFTK